METPTPAATVARNVAELRDARKQTVRTLSAVLADLGHPILPSGITKIEQQQRRVDPGDLVALAIALGVNPNRLLFPATGSGDVALTPQVSASLVPVWAWARGDSPLLAGAEAVGYGDQSPWKLIDDFRRHALPDRERERDDHPAARAASAVLSSVRAVLEQAENPHGYEAGEKLQVRNPEMTARLGPDANTAAGLRARLRTLVASIEELIGDDGGRGG